MAIGKPAALFDHVEIFGTRGSITLARDRLRSSGVVDEDVALDLQANYVASWRGAIEHFLDRLADGGAFETRPEDNLETLRIVEAAYREGTATILRAGSGEGRPKR